MAAPAHLVIVVIVVVVVVVVVTVVITIINKGLPLSRNVKKFVVPQRDQQHDKSSRFLLNIPSPPKVH